MVTVRWLAGAGRTPNVAARQLRTTAMAGVSARRKTTGLNADSAAQRGVALEVLLSMRASTRANAT